MPFRSLLLCSLALFAFFSGPLSAEQVLFDSGVRQPNRTYFSDRVGTTQTIADNFQLANDSEITRLVWTGNYESGLPAQDGFEAIFSVDVDAGPNPVLRRIASARFTTVSRVDTGLDIFGRDVFEYQAIITGGINLSGGQNYFLTLVNETPGNRWAWGADNTFGTAYYSNDNVTYLPFTGTQDFQLYGTAVPEPSGLLLLGVALPWLARRRR